MLQLPVHIPVGCGLSIRSGQPTTDQVVCNFANPSPQLLRRCADCSSDICLVQLIPALCGRRDERNSKAPTPVAKEICQTRGSVVLVWPEL